MLIRAGERRGKQPRKIHNCYLYVQGIIIAVCWKENQHHSALRLSYLQGANRGLRKASPSLWMSLMPSFLSVDCLLSKSCFFCRHCSTVAAGQQEYDVKKKPQMVATEPLLHFNFSLKRGTALFVFICSQDLKVEWTFIIKWTVKMHLQYIHEAGIPGVLHFLLAKYHLFSYIHLHNLLITCIRVCCQYRRMCPNKKQDLQFPSLTLDTQLRATCLYLPVNYDIIIITFPDRCTGLKYTDSLVFWGMRLLNGKRNSCYDF